MKINSIAYSSSSFSLRWQAATKKNRLMSLSRVILKL